MYTNIDPIEGLQTIEKFLRYFTGNYFSKQEKDFILKLLTLVMNNCMFKFGDTWWLQNIGTAMGTPVACIYAILFFGYYERTIILRKYKRNLLFYKRQIDDVLGVWIDDPENPSAWKDFQVDMNNACKLKWTFVHPTTTVDFLDLTITINEQGFISTKTFQKSMNLFLYITPHSAHPPGLMKSLVFGQLLTYYKQNTLQSDFIELTTLLFQRLLDRGHSHDTLSLLFSTAITEIQERLNNPFPSKRTNTSDISSSDTQLLLHMPYHPRDISRQQIRNIYESTCESNINNFNHIINHQTKSVMKISKVTVAYSRPKNIKNYLCPSTLEDSPHIKVSNMT